ncbi:MAG: phosphate transport system permease protein [Crocinitomix sp.]|jgi:phosphate transport system permease protein
MSRKLRNQLYSKLGLSVTFLCLMLLFFLFFVLFNKGIGAVDFEFLTSDSRSFGVDGGIKYQILGSLLMILVASILSFPLAVGFALFKSEYIKHPFWQKLTSIILYGLNGIPSVIYGLFGLIFFVNFLNTGISWFVGSVILAIMMVPTISLASFQAFNCVPTLYRENGLALGLTRTEMVFKVILPKGIGGAITGYLLAMARAIGETAPIMFIATAFSGVGMPGSLFEPVLSLPTHILALSQQATNPKALENAWGASFVLLCFVLIFSLLSMYIRFKKQVERG